MKKFTFLVTLFVAHLFAFGGADDKAMSNQPAKRLAPKQNGFHQQSTRTSQPANLSNVVTFYSEDFGSGTIPLTWNNIDSSGHGATWRWTTTGCFTQLYPGFDSLGSFGTSAANGYMMFDSDSAGASIGGDWGVVITNSIDCSTHSNVHLSFNEFFAFYEGTGTVYPNTARLYVSIDSVNWTEIHAADAGLQNNEFTPNPNAVDLNISAIAANQSNVYLKFSFTGDYSYFWYVDDILFYEPSGTDGKLVSLDLPYNGCTLSNSETISMTIVNNGGNDFNGFTAGYIIGSGSPVTETVTDTVHPGDTLVYNFTTPADLSIPGTYDVTAFVAITGDITQSNDSLTASTLSSNTNTVYYYMGFEPTDDFTGYIVEDVDQDGSTIDISPTYTRSGVACLRYLYPPSLVNADNWVISGCFDLLAANTYLMDFWFKVFDLTSGNPYSIEAYIGTAQTHTGMTLLVAPLTPLDTVYTNANTTFTVPSDGTYYFAFRAYGASVDNTIRIDDIMIDVADKINTTDKNMNVQVYPNPSTGQLYIENTGMKDHEVTVSVLNAVGQVVYNKQFNNLIKESLDLNNFPAGIYTVRFTTASGVVNKSFVLSDK